MNVSYESLEEKFPGEGKDRYNEIAKLAGADPIGGSFTNHDGGLDLTGALDKANEAYDDEARARIKALAEKKGALKPDESATPAITSNATQKEGNN